jgi:hypothetical protein
VPVFLFVCLKCIILSSLRLKMRHECNMQMIPSEPNFEENSSLSATNYWLHKMSVHRFSFSYFIQSTFSWKYVHAPLLLSSESWRVILLRDANTSKKPLRMSGCLQQVFLSTRINNVLTQKTTMVFIAWKMYLKNSCASYYLTLW